MKKIKYKRLKSIALIMSIVMIICSVPMNVVAETEEPTEVESNEIVSDHIELEAEEEVARITEIESLREENVKHFQLPDGTYEMIVYGEAVHRKDTFGKWQDINNNLTLTDVKTESLYASSDMRTVFAQSYRADKPLMTLSENGYSVSMSLVADTIDSGAELMSISEPIAPAVQNATLRDKDAGFETISQAAEIDNRSSIKYQNVKTNVDIEYIMNGNDIKENIIVKARGTSYVYRFDLALTGLTPELSNNTVILKDQLSDEIKYVIPEPYMYDANGNLSYDVTYSLIDRGLGTYRLTVTADATWINAEDRAFPVTVDPTMHHVVLEDTYISQSAPNTKYHTSTSLAVSSTQTAFLRAELLLPDNALVNTAYFNVSYYYSGNVTSGSTTVGVYGVNDEWSESTLTYNTSSDIQIGTKYDQLTLSGTEGATAANPKQVSFDITYLADIWSVGTSNHGVALKYVSHVSNPTVYFVSSNATANNRPSINVNYTYRISNGGVFAIENLGTPNKWLTVASVESRYLTATTSDVSPLDASPHWDFSRLFKITRHANMSSYIIRSMVDNCLSIQPETDGGGNVYWKIVEIDADDANVPASQTFYFQFDGNFGGYRIFPYGDYGNMIHYTSDGSVLGEGPANAASSWSLTKYVGEDKVEHIFTLEDEWIETGALIGTSYTGRILGCSTVPNINRFEWSMSDTHGALSYYMVDEFGDLVFEPTKYVQFSISFRFYAGNSETPYKTTVRYFGTSAEGGFFIQNVATEMYIDIDGGITDDGAAAIQSKYSAMDSQRWIIQTLPDSGATVVKSALSGNYLGISYDDNILLGVYDYVDDFTIWNVEYEDDGTYTFWFTPTGPDGTTVAVPSSSEGARVMMQTDWELYTEDCNKWHIVCKVISMVNYYDSTFASRPTFLEYIDDAVSFANTVYARNFGIGIYMDGAATYDANAIASQCNNTCNCSSLSHDNHHRSLSKMSDYLYNRTQGREVDHIYVMWAHRVPGYSQDYCWINPDTGQHEAPYALGVVSNNRPVINILYVYTGYASINPTLQVMSISLAHEITHCLGMSDVYKRKFAAHEAAEYSCIMDGLHTNSDNRDLRTIQVYNECLNGTRNPFCDDCKPIFSECVSDYTNGIWNISASQ